MFFTFERNFQSIVACDMCNVALILSFSAMRLVPELVHFIFGGSLFFREWDRGRRHENRGGTRGSCQGTEDTEHHRAVACMLCKIFPLLWSLLHKVYHRTALHKILERDCLRNCEEVWWKLVFSWHDRSWSTRPKGLLPRRGNRRFMSSPLFSDIPDCACCGGAWLMTQALSLWVERCLLATWACFSRHLSKQCVE